MNTTHAAAGTYYPTASGARTLAETKALYINGERVSAVVDHDGTFHVFIGGKVVSTGTLDGTEGPLMVFFAAEAMTATAETETPDEAQTMTEAVAEVRAKGQALAAHAAELSSWDEHKIFRNANGKRIYRQDARHPLNAAKIYAARAAVLVAWTEADERAYVDYVQTSIGDTDGWYAPEDRAAWKLTGC